jgi:hypothetical protein
MGKQPIIAKKMVKSVTKKKRELTSKHGATARKAKRVKLEAGRYRKK